MEMTPKSRLISTIRRERTDRLSVAPRHYDPAFLIQSMELPGDLEYYMLDSARPELFRVGLPTHKVSVEATLNLAEKLGFDPVFFKGIRLGLPPGVFVEHSHEIREDLTLITSVCDTPAGQLRKTERQYREERLRRDTSHGASPDRSQEHLIAGSS